MNAMLRDQGAGTFLTIWLGQAISLIGSGLTTFALGVWVYQQTGSAAEFSWLNMFAVLPHVLVTPIAGAIADRWDRRRLMILSDTGAACGTILLFILLRLGSLQLWMVYLVAFVGATFSAIQYPAYAASTSLLVSKEHYGRASGLIQFADAAARILAPLIAAALISVIGLQGIIMIDLATFLVAVTTLLIVRIPHPPANPELVMAHRSFWHEVSYGWTYIISRPGLLALLLFFVAANISIGFVQGLFTPLMLTLSSPRVLGVVVGVGSAGLLLGTIGMSIWGGPKPRIHGVLGLGIFFGLSIVVIGLQTSIIFIAIASFFYFLSQPFINGSNMVIWRSKVPADVQGRVFAALRMIAWSSSPLTYLIAGSLADQVFEPLLAKDGALADSIGQIIGVGPGRGIGLLFILAGSLPIVAAIIGYLYPPLRHVEDDLPDVVMSTATAST